MPHTQVRCQARRAILTLALCGVALAPIAWSASARAAGAALGPSVVVRPPPDAARVPVASLAGVACTSTTSCVAVGRYEASSARGLPLAVTMTASGWSRAVSVALPAVHAGAHSTAGLEAVACPSTAGCVAVGSYEPTASTELAMVATERNGAWDPAVPIAPPAGAASANELAQLGAVSCAAVGSCVAVGTFTTATGATELMEVASTAGVWGTALAVARPADAGTVPHALGSVGLTGLSCADVTDCVAVGSYLDAEGGYAPMRVAMVHGAWGRAVRVHVALRARTVSIAGLAAASCVTATACIAVGAATSVSGGLVAIAAARGATGRWGEAVASARLPAARPSLTGAALDGIACPGTTVCAAVGMATESTGTSVAIVRVQRGAWHTLQVVRSVPRVFGPATSSVLRAVSCPQSDHCVAVGSLVATTRTGTVSDARAIATQLII